MADDTRSIRLRGVRVHNLKGVDLDIPLGKLVAFSGVSGSGKSSLAFDTLYAEGQRRYVETFSAYTRQFLERLDKPDADRIDNIPPAIAVAQKRGKRSSRSTVGTVAEVQDHLGLLFAKVGVVTCRVCGLPVEPADPGCVARALDEWPEGTRYLVTFPVEVRPGSDRHALADGLRVDGFTRVVFNGETTRLEEGPLPGPGQVDVIVDRLTRGSESKTRRLDSIETAFRKGMGRCRAIPDGEGLSPLTFTRKRRCPRDGTEYPEPDPRLFRYNSPLGACPTCEGFGQVIEFDIDKVVPDPSRSLQDNAIAPWSTPAYANNLRDLLTIAPKLGVPVDVPFSALTPEQVAIVVDGAPRKGLQGLRTFFKRLESKTYKAHVRIFLARWRGYHTCPDCQGARLRPESLAVKVAGRSVAEVAALAVREARSFLDQVEEAEAANPVAVRVLGQARARLDALDRIGLHYLALDRPARTLSAGEARRLALASALGSGLVNTLYVLDEPSVGLHPRDVGRLVDTLTGLRDAGNSVVVVEHDESILAASDWLIDIGPGAGESGGRILYEGTPKGAAKVKESATGAFLSGRRRLAVPDSRREPRGRLLLTGATGNNLQNIDVALPLGVLCVVTGVSGAGKSTLVDETLYPALAKALRDERSATPIPCTGLSGYEGLADVVLVDQSPIGRTSRSNPVTYLKAFDEIRQTFAATPEAKTRNLGAGKFSFNVEGGRCNACEGNGTLTVDMQFLADITMTCPECRGTRYRPEVLEVAYQNKTIAEVLELTVREAHGFFRRRPKAQARLRPLLDVGLEYLRLGQPAPTLSGGEAQRLKLASFLASSPAAITRAARGPKTLFLMDEPTAGLHPADTAKLLETLTRLLDLGHSLILVEHAPDVLLAADWIIDVGPEAGDRGGRIVGEGTPEDVAKLDTPTGQVLAALLKQGKP
ncbi:excinuclease ABC subunit UvrA [Tundrisphaera sp. TA3]|uniref:excinuclease ABC subunit UvrA n=1 Tax=Tundrisphaera sp. TA3 TaxID=3435775 RepID=UPI003EBE3F7A